MNTASKCLAHTTGCWDPELEPSIEEIVDYRCYIMAIFSVRFLWRVRSLGGFPYSVHMACGGHVQVNRLKPCALTYGACTVFQCVAVRIRIHL